MGKEKNTTAPKEKNAKGKGPKQPSRLLAFLRGEQARFTAGLLVMLLAALLGIGFLSFVVTGKDDQAILENLSWYQIFTTGWGRLAPSRRNGASTAGSACRYCSSSSCCSDSDKG